MTPDERDQLIQRYYDGETLGAEAAMAEKLLQDDPEAREVLDTLRSLSDSIRVDIAQAVATEDFSSYWSDIAGRLSDEPKTLDGDDLVVQAAPKAMEQPKRSWLAALFHPGFAAAAAALIAIVVFLPQATTPDSLPISYAVDIEEVDSAGPMVIVQEATETAPSIISFVESSS